MALQDLFQEIYGRQGSADEVAALSGKSEDESRAILQDSINAWRAANAPAPERSADQQAQDFLEWQLAQRPDPFTTPGGYATFADFYKAQGIDPHGPEMQKFAQESVARWNPVADIREQYMGMPYGGNEWENPNWREITALERAATEAQRVQGANTPSPFSIGPGGPAQPQNLTLDPMYASILGGVDPTTALRAVNILKRGENAYDESGGNDPRALQFAQRFENYDLPQDVEARMFPSYAPPPPSPLAQASAAPSAAPLSGLAALTPNAQLQALGFGGTGGAAATGQPSPLSFANLGLPSAETAVQATSNTGAPTDVSSAVKDLSLFPIYTDLESGQRLDGYSSAPVEYSGSQIKAVGDQDGNLTGYEGIRQVRIGNNDGIAIDTYDANGKLIGSRVDLDVGNKDTHVVTTYDAAGNVTDKHVYQDTSNSMLRDAALYAASLAIPGAAPFVQGINAARALEQGDILGAVTSGLGAAQGFGMQMPAGLGDITKYANTAAAIASGDPSKILNAAATLTGSSDLKTAATATNAIKAIQSGNPMAMLSAVRDLGNIVNSATQATKAADPNAEMTMYLTGINAGMSEDDAMAFAKSMTSQAAGTTGNFARADRANDLAREKALDSLGATGDFARVDRLNDTIARKAEDTFTAVYQMTGDSNLALEEASKVTGAALAKGITGEQVTGTPLLPESDKGDFAYLGERVDRPVIGNDEANTPEEAAALARVRNPAASGFTFGGQEYTMTVPTGAGGEQTRRQLAANEIANAPTFSDAFSMARAQLGPNKTFEWQGKKYTTEIKANDLGPVPGSKEGDVLGGTPGSLQYLFDPAAYETEKKANAAIDAINARNLSIQSSSAWDKRTNQPISAVDKALHSIADTIRSTEKVVGAAGTQYGTSVAGLMSRLDQALIPPEYLANPTEFQDRQKELFEYRNNALKDLTPTQRDIANGLSSGALTLTGAVVGGIPAAIGLTVADVANSTWNDGVSRKLSDEQNFKRTATMAGIELVMESLGASTLKTILAPVISKLTTAEAIQSGIKPYLKAFGGQQLEEFTTNFMQDLADRSETLGGVNVGKPLDVNQVLDLAKSSFISTTAAIGTIGLGGAAKNMLSPQQIDAINQIEAPEGDTKSILNEKLSTLPPSYFQGLNPIEPETVQFIQSKAVNDPSFLSTLRSNVAGLAMSFGAATAAPTTNIDFSTPTTQIVQTVGMEVQSQIESGTDVSSVVGNAILSGSNVGAVVDSAITSSISAGTSAESAIQNTVASAVSTATQNKADSTQAIQAAVSSAVQAATQNNVNPAAAVGASVSSAVQAAVVNNVAPGEAINASVSSAVQTAVGSGVSVSQAVNTAVSSAVNAAATNNVSVAQAFSSAVNAAITSVVQSTSVTSENITQATSSAVQGAINAMTSSGVNASQATNLVINALTDAGLSQNAATNLVNTAIASATTTSAPTNTAAPATNATNAPPATTAANVTVGPTAAALATTNLTAPIAPQPVNPVVNPAATSSVAPPVVPPITSPVTSPVTPPAASSQASANRAAGALSSLIATGAAGELGRLPPQFLKSWETQKRVDPLADLRKTEQQTSENEMNIDPRLLAIMQERMQEKPYYAYGIDESIDDVMGNASAYKEGGYVQPLMAQGGMALPLLAKNGGPLSQYGGREDFKDGKHVAGEGDGQSDDIPAWLADSEFVLPADVVAALGNGSTKAGTNKLYEMMYAIRERARSTGPKDLPPPALKSPLDYLKSSKRSAK